jgi:hypothetical protein
MGIYVKAGRVEASANVGRWCWYVARGKYATMLSAGFLKFTIIVWEK